MADRFSRLLDEAASLSLDESPPFAVPSPSEIEASRSAAAADARVVGVGSSSSGFPGTVSLLKSYSVLSVQGSDRDVLCMGVVSKTGQLGFCIKKNCTTKSHRSKKFELVEEDASYMYIVRVPGSTMFAEPCIKESTVPQRMLDEWKGMATTLPNWVKAFRAVALMVEVEDEPPIGKDDFKETKLLADAVTFRTPFKKRKGVRDEDDDEASTLLGRGAVKAVKFARHDRGLPSVDEEEALESVIASGSLGKGGLTKIVSGVESSVVILGDALEEVAASTLQRFDENEKEVQAMMGVVQNLFATLGPTVAIDARLEAPTLWGTTAFIAEDVIHLGGVISTLESELKPLADAIESVRASHDVSLLSIATNRNQGAEALEFVMKYVRSVGEELTNLRGAVKKLNAAGGVGKKVVTSPTKVSDFGGSTGAGDPFLMRMRAEARAKEGEDSDREGVKFEELGGEEQISEVVSGMMADIARLELEVKILKANADESTVKFGSLGLKTLQDCHDWMLMHFDENRYGLVMDPLLMLERVFGADTESSHMKTLESRKKLNIKTGSEAAALTALSFPRPRQFHNGKVAMTTERNASRLSKLPNYKSWNSGGQGVRNYVTKQMNLIRATVAHDINSTFGRGPRASIEAFNIATAGLNNTVTFVTQLMVFIDTLYEKLHEDSQFSKHQSWALTTQILDRICEELFAPKEGVQEAMAIDDPFSVCSHVLWSCFKTHDVMAGYIDLQFENHPSIAAEYVKFLATNSGHEKVEKLESAIKEQKEEVAAALKNAKSAVSKADVATGKHETLKSQLDALAKRVAAMEKK